MRQVRRTRRLLDRRKLHCAYRSFLFATEIAELLRKRPVAIREHGHREQRRIHSTRFPNGESRDRDAAWHLHDG